MALEVTLPCGCGPSSPCLRARTIVDGSLSWTDARGSLRWHFVAGLRKAKVLKDRARWRPTTWETPEPERQRCLERSRGIAGALAEVRARNVAQAARGRCA